MGASQPKCDRYTCKSSSCAIRMLPYAGHDLNAVKIDSEWALRTQKLYSIGPMFWGGCLRFSDRVLCLFKMGVCCVAPATLNLNPKPSDCGPPRFRP